MLLTKSGQDLKMGLIFPKSDDGEKDEESLPSESRRLVRAGGGASCMTGPGAVRLMRCA